MSHRYEDAVLKGTALLLLDLPPALLNAPQPLQKLFDTHYPDNGITHILLNTTPIRSTSDENVMECGVVFFSSSKALWTILDRVRVLLRTEDGALELRRGYLTLGVHEVLVEGVVTWGAEGRQRPTSVPQAATPTLAPAVAPCAKDAKNSAMSGSAPTLVSVPATTSATASEAVRAPRNEEVHSSRGETVGGVQSCGAVCETVVVTFLFKEIYNRHRDNREDPTHGRQGGVAASFPLSPFMVYQMLVGECQPRKIVLIECQRALAKREWRALVELENADVAAQVIRVFTRRAVEFISESNAYKVPERSRKPPEKGPLPICAEVRYYVNCYYSVRKGQSHFLPNGARNYHRTVAVRPFCRAELDLTDPQNLARLHVKAPREWKHDPHAIRPASIPSSLAVPARQPAAFEAVARWHDARAAAPREHQNTEAAGPVAAVAPETAVRVEAQSMAAATHAQTQPQQKTHVMREPASATPALPAVAYDSHGPLPVGWRPIFSQEYQQTYYAYRDPNTGVETTTWERPAT
ncbi:hypothetical protein CGC21_38100 [Leishmania donovani]|uniref:WW domain-containing protein n=1 Tax=Leishmania donovani TaxID=5661 RepID=A0A504Y152_LEIDO|nr:hypothetical protein CGC21_38100 [Leishmania donovani]